MTESRRSFARGHPALRVGVAATATRRTLASGRHRAALGILIALSGLGSASPADAEPRLYTGSLVVHAFGNDTTTGTPPPFATATYIGIPLTGKCASTPYHPKETLTFPTTPTGTQVFTFTIPAYGGQFADVDTNGDTVPDIIGSCLDAARKVGDPLAGAGSITTTGAISTSRTPMDPRGFTLPQSALSKIKSGASRENYGIYLWEVHFADLRNEAAAFSKGGGDGSFAIARSGVAKQKRSVTQSAGKNRFGGTMQLLGSYGSNVGYFNATLGVTSVFYYNWLLNYLGGDGQATDMGVVTRGHLQNTTAYGYTVASGGKEYTSYLEVEAFKWTTGSVTVTALGGTFPTILRRKGYDDRTAMGSGVVQMVSPILSKWEGSNSGTASATAAIGILKISFAPEPGSLSMLGAGAIMLGLLVQRRRRHRRSLDAS